MTKRTMSGDGSSCDLLLDRLAKNVAKKPSKIALSFIGPGPNGGKILKKLTYAELDTTTTDLAQRLKENGLVKGDRAVLVYPPSLDFTIAFLACLKASIIAVPVFPPNPTRRDTLHMFSKIVESSGAKFALTSNEYNHLKKIAGVRDTFTRSKRPVASWPEQLEWIITDDGKKPKGSLDTPYDYTTSDIAFLQYTSGSTSEPKGVMITHNNLAHNLTIITAELKAVDDTVVVSWLPQYHDMGLIGSYLGCLYCGGSGYYMSPLSFLQRPMLWIEAVSQYKATHLQAPNFAFALTARKFNASNYTKDNLNVSSVRHMINAAEPVDEESIQAFEAAFGPFGLGKAMFPTYGLAEHTVFVCSGGTQRISVLKEELEVNGKVVLTNNNSSKEGPDISRLVGCGYPAHQGVDVRIVDAESCTQLPSDRVGEIWVQSPSKAAGYFQKQEESKRDFCAQIDSDDGNVEGDFLRTGDLGFLHNDELFICGRLKDLIIVGGRNYYPQDLEATAEASSELLRPGCSAAFTIDPTREGGEEVALVMELRDVPNAKDVESVCGPLANQVRGAINQEHSLGIAQIVLLKTKTVPKTTSGKIARAWCRKAFIAGTLQVVYRKSFKDSKSEIGQVAETASSQPITKESIATLRSMSTEEIISKLKTDISRVGSIPEDSIEVDAPFVTLLDSLTISQFKGYFEQRYGAKISEEYLFRESTTIKKLVKVVKLGYDPDDVEGGEQNGQVVSNTGTADGIAGALGCPPGVVCCVIQ